MVTISVDRIKRISTALFKAAGCSDYEAKRVTDLLVLSNLQDHDSHGVVRVPLYIRGIREGRIKPGAKLEIVKETSTTALINGNFGIGQVIATRGMEIAIEKAKKNSVGVVSIYNCNHIARMYDYAAMALDHDMIGFVSVNVGNGLVTPYGGSKGFLGTNPLCFAIPSGEGKPVILDMATSIHAAGKIRVAYARGERVPEGWIIDSQGNPTTDPAVIYGPQIKVKGIERESGERGSILPFGGEVGYKGYGLCLVADILSGAISGSGCGSQARGNGVFMMALNIESFQPVEAFKARVDGLSHECRSIPAAPGYVGPHGKSEVLVPGDPERIHEEKNRRTGIYIEDTTWNSIVKEAQEFNIDINKI